VESELLRVPYPKSVWDVVVSREHHRRVVRPLDHPHTHLRIRFGRVALDSCERNGIARLIFNVQGSGQGSGCRARGRGRGRCRVLTVSGFQKELSRVLGRSGCCILTVTSLYALFATACGEYSVVSEWLMAPLRSSSAYTTALCKGSVAGCSYSCSQTVRNP